MCHFVRFLNEHFRAVYALLASCKPDKIQNILSQKFQCYKRNSESANVQLSSYYMHLGGLLSTQEARVELGYRLVRLLRFFRA